MVDKIQDRPCEALKSLMGYQQADMDGLPVLRPTQWLAYSGMPGTCGDRARAETDGELK